MKTLALSLVLLFTIPSLPAGAQALSVTRDSISRYIASHIQFSGIALQDAGSQRVFVEFTVDDKKRVHVTAVEAVNQAVRSAVSEQFSRLSFSGMPVVPGQSYSIWLDLEVI